MSEGSLPEPPSVTPSDEFQHDNGVLAQVHAVEFTAYFVPIPPPDPLQRFDEI